MNERVYRLANLRSWRGQLSRVERFSIARPALIAAAFVVFTLGMMWPLPLRAGSAVQDLGDPLYQIWTIRRVQHQFVSDPAHLWDGNTGYPFSDSLLFSEPQLSTSVIAWPIQIVTRNDVLTYNLMFMGTYVLVGLSMTLLIWELTREIGAAIVTGFVSAFVPYRFGHLSHLNLVNYGWGLLALWSLMRFARRRRLIDAVLSAVFLSIQVLASETLGVMTGFVVGSAIVMLAWQERKRLSVRFVGGLAAIVLLPAAAALPVVLARLRVDRMYGFTRDLSTINQLSATFQTYWSVCPGSPFWRAVHILPSAYPNPLFPGVIASLAAIAGLAVGARFWPRWTLYGAFIAIVGFTLSLGPFTVINGHRYHLPYYVLYLHVPGFSAMRDAARFGMVALIGIEILAGLGLAALWKTLSARVPARSATIAGTALLVVLLVGSSIDLKINVGTVTVPKDTYSTAVYDWLATQPKAPVIEFPANGLWTDVLLTTHEIYFSTRNWDPIVAAYASFVPQRAVDMLVAIHGDPTRPSLVNSENVGLLQDLGIRYVVIHHWPDYDWKTALDEAERLPQLSLVGDFGDATVFTVARGDRRPVSTHFNVPQSAYAGHDVVAEAVTRNENATRAISWLKQNPVASVSWKSATGEVVSKSEVPLQLSVTANPGLTIQPITLTAPAQAGTYQLTIACPGLADLVSRTVEVSTTEPATGTSSDAGLVLRRLSISSGPYRPGDWVDITAEWEVRRQPAKDLTTTIQLLDEQGKPFSQWDGQPFGAALPTSQWTAGSVIAQPLLVQIPSDTALTQFRALIALYDQASPTLEHAKIEGPDGTTALQFITPAMKIMPAIH